MKLTKGILLLGVLFLFVFTAAIGAEDEEASLKLEKVREISRNAFVEIRYKFADPMKVVDPVLQNTPLVTNWKEYWTNDRPYITSGVLVGQNSVLTARLWLLPEMLSSVVVKFMDGTEVNAKVEEYLVNAPGMILYLEKPRTQGALSFKPYVPDSKSKLFIGWLNRIRDFYLVGSTGETFDMESTSDIIELRYSPGNIFFNENTEPIGYNFTSTLVMGKDWNNWIAADYLAGPRKTVPQAREYSETLKAMIGKDILPVKFSLRGLRAGTEDPVEYGVCVDGNGTLLVPSSFNADQIKNIQKIMVSVGGKEVEGKFIGVLERYSAVLVRLPDLPGPSAIISTDGVLNRYHMYETLVAFSVARRNMAVTLPALVATYSISFDEKYYLKLSANSSDDSYGSYGSDRTFPTGAFIFDHSGHCIGIQLLHRREFQQVSESAGRYWSDDRQQGTVRPVPFSEIVPIAAAPTDHIVPNLRPMSVIESRKIVWLGVEMQPMNRNLAEHLDVLEVTKMGNIGGRITWVYKDSPADRAGLKIGDIILAVGKKDSPTKLELNQNMVAGYGWNRSGPWPNRRYPLILELTKLGEGTDVIIGYLRGKNPGVIEMPLEAAPPDFVAAKYYKCWELGFRVKDLTYEVRRYFSIKDDQNGVIVYQVESGSKAAIAEMGAYYIIVKVNGVDVKNSDHAKELLNKAIDEDPSETVNIEVLSYGETRFFEIRKPSKEEVAKIREEHQFDPEDEGGAEGSEEDPGEDW